MMIKELITNRLIIKSAKGILVAIVLIASIATIYTFVVYSIGSKRGDLSDEAISRVGASVEYHIAEREEYNKSLTRKEVIRYGRFYKDDGNIAGVMEFFYFDIDKGVNVVNWQIYPWFRVGIVSANGDKAAGNFVNYIMAHENDIFKIVGKKEADDCRGDPCTEKITIKELKDIQAISK